MPPEITVLIEYGDHEERRTPASLWAVAALPRKPVHRMRVLQSKQIFEIHQQSEYAVVVMPPGVWRREPGGDPVCVYAVSRHGTQVAGQCWRFYSGAAPEIDDIDLPRDSPLLPPATLFLPGTLFEQQPGSEAVSARAPWWRRVLALDARLWAGR